MLILDVHRPAEHDEPTVAVEARLRIGLTMKVMEPNAVAARPNQRIENAERLGGNVLKDE
jgi:hypothetical protein